MIEFLKNFKLFLPFYFVKKFILPTVTTIKFSHIFLRKTTYYIDNKKIIDNKNIF